jgi:hypothetical protein
VLSLFEEGSERRCRFFLRDRTQRYKVNE